MAQFDTAETDQVAELLRAAGYSVSAPVGHTAKSPDLLVDGTLRCWAEVKTLADTPQVKSFDLARQYLRPRTKDAPCAIDLYVCEQARHREFKLLHQLILDSISARELPCFALLSDDYTIKNRCKYTLKFKAGEYVPIFAYLSENLRVVAPWQLEAPVFGQEFSLDIEEGPRTLRTYSDEFVIGAHLYYSPPHTGLVGTSHSRGMWKSTSQGRFRRDVAKANKQISDACKIEDLPGILFLVAYASRTAFVTALLGDPMIAVPTRDGAAAEAFYGKNGAFRRDQNTHVSAAYLLNGEDIYFLANPFARQPVTNLLANAQVISIDSFGAVTGA